ncbi:hypothetical protein [Novosphingobium cyanobacteriorum]|uniref:Uncharacterized protein n=1 Tax=Novosphingobium cyanobacteriorum TaxID=3024215 RepID=A0ABT6CJZ2_9SPHN|nr:hypothetical protein [Novosphingobium cyanobacteriorum]MDF8333390.1 hypothetical protein [Novosphingobium cyanobacteriorum]
MSYAYPEDERTGNYVMDHWRGNLPLANSYWINGGIVLFLANIAIGAAAMSLRDSSFSLQFVAIAGIVAFALLIVLWVWAAVGIWRSASRHAGRGGSSGWAVVAKAMMVLGALNQVVQLARIEPLLADHTQLAAGMDPIGESARLTVDGDALTLSGWISSGSSGQFAALLGKHPEVHRILLRSQGGRTREATSIAAAISARKLDTMAVGPCASSCTIVFLAGKHRFAESGSSLGFHSPSLAGLTDDVAKASSPEMRDAYEKAGLPAEFIERALSTSSKSIWSPTEVELVQAGVINAFSRARIVDSNQSTAKAINKAGARQIDNYTVLSGARANGTELVYLYTVNVPADRIPRGTMQRIGRGIQLEECSNKGMHLLIRSGASMSYEYRDPAGRLAGTYRLDRCPEIPDYPPSA